MHHSNPHVKMHTACFKPFGTLGILLLSNRASLSVDTLLPAMERATNTATIPGNMQLITRGGGGVNRHFLHPCGDRRRCHGRGKPFFDDAGSRNRFVYRNAIEAYTARPSQPPHPHRSRSPVRCSRCSKRSRSTTSSWFPVTPRCFPATPSFPRGSPARSHSTSPSSPRPWTR